MRARPKLTADTVVEYLDWVTENCGNLLNAETHLRAAELVIRTQMGEAQAKDTQHTLVRDGLMDAPPPAPGGGQNL